MSFLDDLEAYTPVAGSKQSEPSTKSSFTSGFPADTYKHPKNPQSSTEGKRIDPRTGDILRKAQIPHPSGRQITIDYNPKTGGVFLDSGELKDLSEIKDIIPRLETILSTNI